MEKGLTRKMFSDGLKKHLIEKGWYGREDKSKEKNEKYLNWRLDIIYQTNMMTAYSAGRYSELMRSTGLRPIWVYSAIMDDRTRATHKAIHGKAFRYDDPFWDIYYPPNGWRCRCSVYSITEAQAAQRGIEILTETPEFCKTKKFCPDEWQYNPGQAKYSPDWAKYDYLKKYITGKDDKGKNIYAMDEIKKSYMEGLKKIEITQTEWENWIDEVRKKDYKSQGYERLIIDNIVKLNDPRLFLKDEKILHSKRKNKPRQLNDTELRKMYSIIKNPDIIIKEINRYKEETILYIKKIDEKECIKIAFTKKNENTTYSLSTAERFNIEDLNKKGIVYIKKE
jgi:SPP1 gp7 family putative phage head morphogenesis protein